MSRMFSFLIFLILDCYLFLNTTAYLSKGCDPGWLPYGDHCYFMVKQKKTWYDAKSNCDSMGSYLVRVDDIEENEWIKIQIRSTVRMATWTGGVDFGHEGKWKWESDGKSVAVQGFLRRQPDNAGNKEHCLEFHGSGSVASYKWNDRSCDYKTYSLCEKSRV
uniref:C-type lectin domain-containing protein n=1 Tax=Pinctada fucata TaxID=50426 RepID=A0A194AMS9_PINFU